MRKVRHLDLSECRLGPILPREVVMCANLTYLDLSRNRFSSWPKEFPGGLPLLGSGVCRVFGNED